MIFSNKTFIIAEIGKNFIQTEKHQPDLVYLKNAKRLVDEAIKAGADAVKFQTHNYKDEQVKLTVFAPHFSGSDRYKWVKRNTLSYKNFWQPLKNYCDRKKIIFFSTPMSRGAAKMLLRLNVPLWKVGSGDILDFVMLDFLRNQKMPIILSSGMSTLSETKKAINFIKQKNKNITLLHCVSKYPCPPADLNLLSIPYLEKTFKIPIGFSDHSLEIEPVIAAVALGAKVIEKHFSLSRTLWGSDHRVSLTPLEFKKMVSEIRKVESNDRNKKQLLDNAKQYLGRSAKLLQEDEALFRPYFRKALLASRDIRRGELIKPEMLHAMRPLGFISGLASHYYQNVVGKKAAASIKKQQPITKQLLK